MRTVLEREFVSFDGVPLFYRHWPLHDAVATGTPRAVVLLHRGHEHSGRVMHLAEELDMPDAQFFAWDARGNGRSPACVAMRRASRRWCAIWTASSRIFAPPTASPCRTSW